MGFPLQLVLHLGRYLITKKLMREERFPLVLMLEPTHRCNLSCAGCGRIREYRDTMEQVLSMEECLASAMEADAPVVAVSGGEPLLHPEIAKIVSGLILQGRFVYVCTNGVLMKEALKEFRPSPHLSFNVHLDGMAETHDSLVRRRGTFAQALTGIEAAKQEGFQVCTNTTVYKDTNPADVVQLISHLTNCGINGVLLSPAFSYEAVDDDIFLTQEQIHRRFQDILSSLKKVRFFNTPVYLEFLKGERTLECTPWGNPTRTPQGWKRPCYLLTDDHCESFQQLMKETDWDRYGPGRDPRCANCKVHSGFEASAAREMFRAGQLAKAMVWGFTM